MKYKDVLLAAEDKENEIPIVEDKWVSWEEANNHISKLATTSLKPPGVKSSHGDAAFEVMCDNDHLVYHVLQEAKERYEFEGVLTNPDPKALIQIFMKHMRAEEWNPAEDDIDGGDDEDVPS